MFGFGAKFRTLRAATPIDEGDSVQVIDGLVYPALPKKSTAAEELTRLAQIEANKFPRGSMSADDIKGVWERYPDFGPGGQYFRGE